MDLRQSIRVHWQIYGGSTPLWSFRYYFNWLIYYLHSKRRFRTSRELFGLTNFFFSRNPRAVLEYAVRKEDERFYWVCRDYHTLRRLKASGVNAHLINDSRALNLNARTGLWAFAHTGFLNLPPFFPSPTSGSCSGAV